MENSPEKIKLLGLPNLEDGGKILLRKDGRYLPIETVNIPEGLNLDCSICLAG
jgi:hypothetical protein